jgi:hypothetical protein
MREQRRRQALRGGGNAEHAGRELGDDGHHHGDSERDQAGRGRHERRSGLREPAEQRRASNAEPRHSGGGYGREEPCGPRPRCRLPSSARGHDRKRATARPTRARSRPARQARSPSTPRTRSAAARSRRAISSTPSRPERAASPRTSSSTSLPIFGLLLELGRRARFQERDVSERRREADGGQRAHQGLDFGQRRWSVAGVPVRVRCDVPERLNRDEISERQEPRAMGTAWPRKSCD